MHLTAKHATTYENSAGVFGIPEYMPPIRRRISKVKGDERMGVKQELIRRRLPELLRFADGTLVHTQEEWIQRRKEIAETVNRDFAGFPPEMNFRCEKNVLRREKDFFGGKAEAEFYLTSVQTEYSETAFPVTLTVPKKKIPVPFFVYIGFTGEPADGIGEEITDAGYAMASVCYQEITPDSFDGHKSGMGKLYARNPYDSWGKLRIWAWATSRILDCLAGDERLDFNRAAVMGHSRLGKAALLAGAFDTRFRLTAAIQSGAGGAALFRGKSGEKIENLYGEGSRLWFDGNFFQYREETLPFDQHYLLAMIAPRYLYIGSAERDGWADPKSEFLGCIAASPAFELSGVKGLCCDGEYPKTDQYFHEGHIGYFLRRGTHYLSRDDWKKLCIYRKKHQI